MERESFVKFVTDWVWYERSMMQLEKVGFNFTPEHPMWKISDRYAELLVEKFGISECKLREILSPLFIDETIVEVETFILGCASALFS